MTTIQTRSGKTGTTYRVQCMRDGHRLSKSFQTKKDVQRFAAKKPSANGESGAAPFDALLQPATVNRYKAALGSLYRYLLHEYDIDHNPVRGLSLNPENNARTRSAS